MLGFALRAKSDTLLAEKKDRVMLKKLFKSIRANILVGLFLAVPIVATVLVFNFLFKLATGWMMPSGLFPELETIWHGYLLRALYLIGLLHLFYIMGLLTRNFLGRRLYQLGDGVLARIPLIKGIYVSVRQISQSLFTQRKTLFKEVVLVQYPRRGLHSLAFVMSGGAVAPGEDGTGTHPTLLDRLEEWLRRSDETEEPHV